jgi:N-acetylglucosaminyldiphosphoundecaprenol N-acetyl-beta-D-mannosaminyltransferase
VIVDSHALSHRKQRPSPGDEVMLLGVRFDHLTRTEAHAALALALGRGEAWKVYIVNAHTVNLAWEDPSFRRILNEADLVLNDGTGVRLASRMAGKPFPDNLVGTDLVPEFCEQMVSRSVGVFLLGGEPGVAEQAAKWLCDRFPGLRIYGTHHGHFRETENKRIVDEINRSGSSVLLVAFGNPLQERWIHRNAASLRCDVCIGVGGLFDHMAGRLNRAPRWMRHVGIEWIYILVSQPHKWRRYILGNPLFLMRAVRSRLGWGP